MIRSYFQEKIILSNWNFKKILRYYHCTAQVFLVVNGHLQFFEISDADRKFKKNLRFVLQLIPTLFYFQIIT